jgi:CRP-like cAMP-binding protein
MAFSKRSTITKEEALQSFISKFKSFNQDEINAIIGNTAVESIKKGTIVLKEGKVSTNCYFVLSGCIRQYQIVNGEDKTTAFFTEGQVIISYSSYLDSSPCQYNFSCLEDSILAIGTREQEQKLHKQFPKLEHLVHTLMPEDYSKVQERLASLMNNTPEERYQLLIRTQPELLGRVPFNQLASYIGVTPESFSRIRKRIFVKEKSKG